MDTKLILEELGRIREIMFHGKQNLIREAKGSALSEYPACVQALNVQPTCDARYDSCEVIVQPTGNFLASLQGVGFSNNLKILPRYLVFNHQSAGSKVYSYSCQGNSITIGNDITMTDYWNYVPNVVDQAINNVKAAAQTVKKTIQSQPKIPTELKDIDGVKAFQDWLDTNKSGWATGYSGGVLKGGKGHGRFGPRTTRAWGLYKDIYLNPPSKIPPLTKDELRVLDGVKSAANLTASLPTVQPSVLPSAQLVAQTQTPDQYYQQLVNLNLIDPVGGRRIVYKGTPPAENVKKAINDYLTSQGYTLKTEKSKNDGREKIVWTK